MTSAPRSTTIEVKTAERMIPFGRPMIGPDEKYAVLAVLSKPTLTHGPVVRELEESFAAFSGASHALAVSSCTAGLHLAYMHMGLSPGDEVIVPALTHVATAHAVELCGATPVFVDVDESTGNLDLDRVEAAINDRTRAISPVHFLGLPVDMTRLTALARRHGLHLVEDCALAIGATLDGRHVGTFGDAGCFSFYPVKHITTGEGGMLITSDGELAARAARQRAFGIDRNIVAERPVPGEYDVTELGHNYRMTEIAAALGVAQMEQLPAFLAARRSNHAELAAGLRDVDGLDLLQSSGGRFQSACYCLSVVLKDSLATRRPRIIEMLRRLGIGTSIYYPKPVPHLRYYRQKYGFADNSFPVASRLSARSIALPVGPHLMDGDVPYIVASVKDVLASARSSVR